MTAALRSMPILSLNSHRKSEFRLTHTRKGKKFPSHTEKFLPSRAERTSAPMARKKIARHQTMRWSNSNSGTGCADISHCGSLPACSEAIAASHR